MNYDNLQREDPRVYAILEKEIARQKEGLEMIPSENYTSEAVLEANGSIFTNKYAEGYPGKRYYGGCVNIDELERLTQARAREIFGAAEYHVNVQPYSGSPANIAVYTALLEFGDTIMALRLDHGGHLTHGAPASLSGRAYKFVHYEVDAENETLDYEAIRKMALECKPKMIVSGFTSYPRLIDFAKIHEIAKEVGAISMADISHISGLIIGGVHPSPFPFTDVVTTTSHKTLRGPRAAMIFCKQEYKEQIDKAVFPGMQGGPHEHIIAGIAVALEEASKDSFKEYAKQIAANAKVLADTLKENRLKLISDGTDTHLMLIDLRPFGPGRGIFIEKACDAANITLNKNPIPNDPSPPYYPSGVRLGTPALTSRGMKEEEMKKIGAFIARIVHEFAGTELPEDKTLRLQALKDFSAAIETHSVILEIKTQVKELASTFPVPGID